MEKIGFKISGEFITDLARTQFWEEEKSFSECASLLESCLMSDEVTKEELQEIIVKIIEGRLKLVGINTFTLKEDNENVRPLSMKLKQYEEQQMITKIKESMIANPILYVDPFCAAKSYKVLVDSRRYNSVEEIMEYYYDADIIGENAPTWVLAHPRLVYDLMKCPVTEYNRAEFLDKLYEWKDAKDPTKKHYYQLKAMKERTNSFKNKEEYTESDYRFKDDEKIMFLKKPDNYLCEYGWINLYGEWYSCEFGSHAVKAETIVKGNEKLLKKYKEWYNSHKKVKDSMAIIGTFPQNKGWKIEYSDSFTEFLLESGWVKFHNPHYGPGFPERYSKKLTKEQDQALFEVSIKYGYTIV